LEIDPSMGEVYASIEFFAYQQVVAEEEAYYLARDDIIEERLYNLRLAHERWQNDLRTMPYRLYLDTPEWHERAARATERAGHRCWLCNRAGDLDVHHRTYERRGAELDSDLVALCRTCHSLFHEWLDLAG
jgi:5-methylcytosine-specific restriction endonuclease McrA